VSATGEREDWIAAVKAVAADRGLTYEEVGGLNPRDAPPALCPGGSNRLTGELAAEFWGSSCDADEFESGGLFRKAVLPAAVLAKAHMPDLTKVVPAFDVESIESSPDEQLRRLSRLRVEPLLPQTVAGLGGKERRQQTRYQLGHQGFPSAHRARPAECLRVPVSRLCVLESSRCSKRAWLRWCDLDLGSATMFVTNNAVITSHRRQSFRRRQPRSPDRRLHAWLRRKVRQLKSVTRSSCSRI